MKKHCIAIMIFLLCLATESHAQDNTPTLKGKMILSVKNGTMDCDFTLTDIPRLKNYYIRINTGMNIRNFRNTKNGYEYYFEKDYNDTTRGESFGYYFPDSTGKAKFIPNALHFNYVGKFPVIADTLNAAREDWKGNIAFNGYSVRADGQQSAWYPVLYDIQTDKMYHKMVTIPTYTQGL